MPTWSTSPGCTAPTPTTAQPDRLLPGYEALEFAAPDDYDGRVVTTLVRLPAGDAPRGAVLYVHGFIDYFFQRHMAERFAAEGYAFYALDLRKHGRSLLPHQHPCFCKDIAEYYGDITRALAEIDSGVLPAYVRSLHKNWDGEWDFDLTLKPLLGFPACFGWVRAIFEAHAKVHAGLSLACPVLSMHSDEADIILNWTHVSRWSHTLGNNVSVRQFPGGLHDLVLSRFEIREEVFRQLFAWASTQ